MEADFSQSRRATELTDANSCLGQNHVLPPQVTSGATGPVRSLKKKASTGLLPVAGSKP